MAEDGAGKIATPARRTRWKQDPERVRANILKVARGAFAEHGLTGARIDEIAAKTETSKRMIYYYFGDKESLYRAVLEDTYAEMRRAEDALDLEAMPPDLALRTLAEFTFDHHRAATEFVKLVMIENVHGGTHIDQSSVISARNSSAVRHLEDIYARGCDQGLFRSGLTALELHWHISALCFFNVANKATFSRIFGDELFGEDAQAALRQHVGESVVRFAAL